MHQILTTLQKMRTASREIALAGANLRNGVLAHIARELDSNRAALQEANNKDIAYTKSLKLRQSLIDRLILDDKAIDSMIQALQEIAAQPEVIGKVIDGGVRPSGIRIIQVRIPLGVVAMIYESRPNVTIDAAALCIKSGNAVLLKGGKEAYHSNLALSACITRALEAAKLPSECVCMLDSDRETLIEVLQARSLVDVVIPRGGSGLVEFVLAHSKIPVIFHDKGVCHAYIDKSAQKEHALAICLNAKLSRPSACNAIETILVHKDCEEILCALVEALVASGVEVRACALSLKILQKALSKDSRKILSNIVQANSDDFGREFGALIVSLKVVESLAESIAHIAEFGSQHSEIIITQDMRSSKEFCDKVDAAAVFVNASSRFNDGGEFGLGAEIGISTQKLHVRGPMGAIHLTTTKYIVQGEGSIRN